MDQQSISRGASGQLGDGSGTPGRMPLATHALTDSDDDLASFLQGETGR